MARHKDGLLKTDFKQALGKVSYHYPAHTVIAPDTLASLAGDLR